MPSSLRNLCVLCVSAVSYCFELVNRRERRGYAEKNFLEL